MEVNSALLKSPPLSAWRLACANLRRKPFRTGCLVAIVALFSAVLFGGAVLHENAGRGLLSISERLGADLIVVPAGHKQDMQVALLRGEPSSFSLPAEIVEQIRATPGVAQATPQLFLASMEAACCTVKVQLVGFDPQTDFVVRPWLQQRVHTPLQDTEVVVGASIFALPGDAITFFGKQYTVAAKMGETGMGFDASVFFTLDAARVLLRQNADALKALSAVRIDGQSAAVHTIQPETSNPERVVSSVMVKLLPQASGKSVASALRSGPGAAHAIEIVETAGMISALAANLTFLSYLLLSASALVWILALFTMFLVFSASLNERKKEFAILRILGATRLRLACFLLLESFLISLWGGLVGIVCGWVLVFPFSTLIFRAMRTPYLQVTPVEALILAASTLAVAAVVGPIASMWSTISLTRLDVYATMREGE